MKIAIATFVLVAAAAAHADQFAIVASQAVNPDGSLRGEVAVVIEDGKITSVISPNDLSSMRQVRYEGVLSPGLIDLHTSLGVDRRGAERLGPIDSAPNAVDGVDLAAPDVIAAWRAGVTSALITPPVQAPINGVGAVIRLCPNSGAVEALADGKPLVIGLGPQTWDPNGEPTSRAGALSLLREAMNDTSNDQRLGDALAGRLSVLVECAEAQDVDAALRLLSRRGVRPILAIQSQAADVAEGVAAGGSPALVGPYGFATEPRELAGAAALSQAGVELGFRSGGPGTDPRQLRITAALAVNSGMEANAARRALTSGAAAIAGVADRIGSIERGRDADLVIFSSDPLRLDARVLAVYCRGELVYAAEAVNGASNATTE